MNVRTRWCSRSASSSPTALNTPGAGGTMTVADARGPAAISAANSGPLPPNATIANSRGSRPRSTVTARTARAIRAQPSRKTPCAASWSDRPSGVGHLLRDGPPGELAVEAQAARQPLVVEVAERDVGVGQRRLGAAVGVARGSRDGAGAARPDVELPGVVDPDDAAAARPDLGDVDGRHAEQEARSPC